jgi:hypothetical protein
MDGRRGLVGFSLFNSLPTELRLRIWELVPVATRLLVLLPCPCTRTHTRLNARQFCKSQRHLRASCAFCWYIYPKTAAIPATLHCCRESRKALIRRYSHPPCHTGTLYPELPVAFRCPFVDYSNDVFIIRRPDTAWPADWGAQCAGRRRLPQQPLLGFDTSRIQHIGWLEGSLWGRFAYRGQHAQATRLHQLPTLQDLTIFLFDEGKGQHILDQLSTYEHFSLVEVEERSQEEQGRKAMRDASKQIQAIFWHAKKGIEIALWNQLQQTLDTRGLGSMKEMECRCTLGPSHTVSLESEVVPLRWMRVDLKGDREAQRSTRGFLQPSVASHQR